MINPSDWQTPSQGLTAVEMVIDDVSHQMASSTLSRYPRNSIGQKPGNSMRVVKPNSTSNSPRGSIGLGRRRTVMNDGAYRRRLAMLEQNSTASGEYMSNDGLQVPIRSNRPVSWHPGSQLAPQPTSQPSYTVQTPDVNPHYQYFDFSPTPTVYSGYTSPASAFSPISIPFTGYGQFAYPYQQATTSYPSDYIMNQQMVTDQPVQPSMQPVTAQDPTMYSHFDWNDCGTGGFEDSTTAPPTPENFLPIQHPEPTFPAEESIPYHPLSDEDDGEEELIGMGLYDSPEPAKTPSSDPQLDNYRAMMMSSLFGVGARRVEPTGKGLKLEETWNPPPSDDEEEDEDEEQDGLGEDEDETSEADENVTSNYIVEQGLSTTQEVQETRQVYAQDGSNWL